MEHALHANQDSNDMSKQQVSSLHVQRDGHLLVPLLTEQLREERQGVCVFAAHLRHYTLDLHLVRMQSFP